MSKNSDVPARYHTMVVDSVHVDRVNKSITLFYQTEACKVSSKLNLLPRIRGSHEKCLSGF